jgi:hypothetical protein
MAIFTMTDCMLIVNGVTLSDHADSVTVTDTRDEVDITAFGATSKAIAAGKTHATLQPLIGSTTPVAVEVRPTSGARSATNPAALLAGALLTGYTFLAGGIGEASKITAAFRNAAQAGMAYPTS